MKKNRKIIASICVSAISIYALALSASAASSFSGTVNGAPVSGSISISSRMALATASIGDNPDNYKIAQVQINMDYITQNNIDGYKTLKHKTTNWSDGGNGCYVPNPTGYTIVSANAENNFNINGVTRSFNDSV